MRSARNADRGSTAYMTSDNRVLKPLSECVGPSLQQCKKLTDGTKHQFIKLHDPGASGLPYSAKFRRGHLFWKLHGEECLVTIGSSYVAQVTIDNIPELDNQTSFVEAKRTLMRRLKIKKVLLDECQQEIETYADSIKVQLEQIGEKCVTDLKSAKSMLDIIRIAEKHKYQVGFNVCKDLCKSKFINDMQLKIAVVMYVSKKNFHRSTYNYQRKAKIFDERNKTKKFLQKSLNIILGQHKKELLKCFSSTIGDLTILKPRHCLLIRANDINLFSSLESVLKETMYVTVLSKIANNFINRVAALKLEDFDSSLPVTNEIYFYVCRSLMEIAMRVETTFGIGNVIKYAEDHWEVTVSVNHSSQTAMEKCLKKQLQVLVEMANHFEPGKATAKQNYPYRFQSKLFKGSDAVHYGQHLWMCLADATMVSIFENNEANMKKFSAVFDMFSKYLTSEHVRDHSQESWRILTHNMLEFVAQVEQSEFTTTEMEKKILMMQINCMKDGSATFEMFRDAMDVFKEYQKWINKILSQLPLKLQGNHMTNIVKELQSSLLDIPFLALQKKVPLEDVTSFFRAYCELLIDFNSLTLEWYVQISNNDLKKRLIDNKYIECVQNRLKQTTHECYLVLEHDVFAQIHKAEGIPQHYQAETLMSLFKYIADLIEKHRWKQHETLSEQQQLQVSILLISAVRSTLPYVKEQPEYLNFAKYYEERTTPFHSVIEESASLENFTKRVSQIKKSFRYSRNQRAIGIEKALDLSKSNNTGFNERLLANIFNRYNDQYEKYMRDYADKDDTDMIDLIVQDTQNKVYNKLHPEWSPEFKRNEIPCILAGPVAVWSILVSEDVSQTGQYLKPHTIQVLSILRLLSLDNYNVGVENHLAQILTGQGKSVILGLTAVVLALLGHNVEIVCYSEYLVERDANDFQSLFQKFSIDKKISYKTFQDTASEQFEPLWKKAEQYIAKSMGIKYGSKSAHRVEIEFGNNVLLIDEVDVFFMDKFYGNTLVPTYTPSVTGLGIVQEWIWKRVHQSTITSVIVSEVQHFIDNSDHPDVKKLKALMELSDQYILFDKSKFNVGHTNRTLLLEHFTIMTDTALDIRFRLEKDVWIDEFSLDSSGIITMKDDVGVYQRNIVSGYNNIFIYFKLRKENYKEIVDEHHNFGYLNIPLAAFSFAKMPEKYPLILGVTGTLTSLNDYEKDVIENQYKIIRRSIMPSFFGSSNLKFDQHSNFHCVSDEMKWRNAIFTRINEIVQDHRSVIVFFYEDNELSSFKQEFKSKLDRMNEITINTDNNTKNRYIADAGIAKTVTLATSEMGRGVDYKSSTVVEMNGGIHVIQTCFLTDEKEETQIKGRTARKDNHGSYELIVCRSHLLQLGLIEENANDEDICYEMLHKSRVRLAADTSKVFSKRVQTANEQHEECIKFCNGL
nr:uncharacterized protein LOC115265423 [Aedes albopictus]